MSSQLELHRDLDDHIDGAALSPRGRKAPLTNGLDGAIVQAAAETLQNLHVPDRAVAADDDLEDHVARDPALPRIFRIVGFHLAQQARRLDAAAGPIGSAARAAARA